MMWRIRQSLARFMYGRYGIDKFYWFLIAVWGVFTVINRFVGSFLIYLFCLAVMFYAFFRVFSRNIYKRQLENSEFLKFWSALLSYFRLLKSRIKDIGTKRYRKCKNCKAVLRLPIKRGTNTVSCPKCAQNFKVTIIF